MEKKDPVIALYSHNDKTDLMSGLRYTHVRLNDATKKILESTSFLYALIELLNNKNIISIEELDDQKKAVAERLVKKFSESGIGLMYQEPEYDKYTFDQEADVDCKSCLHVCKAACCKIPFALSRQDVEEGIIQWEFGRPYLIAHDNDGYCVHLDKKSYQCTAHEHRPVPCRGFDCQDNKKWEVWVDFEKKQLHDELEKKIEQSSAGFYTCPK